MYGSFNSRSIASDLLLATASSKESELKLSILVSREDGTIFDAKFCCSGPPYCIGMCEILTENFIRKTYAQIANISASYIEKLVEDKTAQTLNTSTHAFINTLLELIDTLVEACSKIPVQTSYLETPIEESFEERCIEDFFERSYTDQLGILNEVITSQIQPYIALDNGSVEITKIEKKQIQIKYDGSCTSCIAATGSTLDSIQKILRARVHPNLSVQVDIASLSQ
jgi:NifU-like protein